MKSLIYNPLLYLVSAYKVHATIYVESIKNKKIKTENSPKVKERHKKYIFPAFFLVVPIDFLRWCELIERFTPEAGLGVLGNGRPSSPLWKSIPADPMGPPFGTI